MRIYFFPAPLRRLSTTVVAFALLSILSGCDLLRRGGQAERPEARIVAIYILDAEQIGTVDDVPIFNGGYSALSFGPDSTLWTATDRGPNLEASAATGQPSKRFLLPGFAPNAQRLSFADGRLTVQEKRPFVGPGGRLMSGIPVPILDPSIVVEQALGPNFELIAKDALGIDVEGIDFGGGHLWVAEEYHPSLLRVDPATGNVLERFTPTPREAYDRPLPTWLLDRTPNLGFEGIAYVEGFVYAALQGPIRPAGGDISTRITRLLRLDPASGEVLSYAYALEGSTRKIGDLSVLPDGRLLVLEHGDIPVRGWSAEVYAIDLSRLSPIGDGNLPPERYRDPESAVTGGVVLVPKMLYVDLMQAGWLSKWAKPEGLAVSALGQLLLVNDNDFGLDSPQATGAAVPTNAETVLVVVE